MAESARLYSEEEERLASKVRKQSWFSARKDGDVTATFSAWMDLLTPATPCKVLREVLRFTETVLEWVAQTFFSSSPFFLFFFSLSLLLL